MDKEPIKEGDRVFYYSPSRGCIAEGTLSYVIDDEFLEINDKFVMLTSFVGKDLEDLKFRVRKQWAQDREKIEETIRRELAELKADSEKFESALASFTQKG